MNKLSIAICLLGFIALATTAPAPEQCLQLLAEELLKTEVSERVPAYVDYLDSVLPVDGENEWDEAEFKKIESWVEYPWEDCAFYLIDLSTTVDKVLAQRNDCAEVINKTMQEPKHDDDQALKELRKNARAHEILGPEMKAKSACTKFQPYKDLVALPPCFQKIVDRARTVDVPEVVEQFVIEARKMKEIVDEKTVQRFRSDDLVEKCITFLETTKDIDLQFNGEDCPAETKEVIDNLNLVHGLSRVAMEDEQFALVSYAGMGCTALLTPEFGMGGENQEFASTSW